MSLQITTVIPTYKRTDKLLVALDKIQACQPRPDEVLVHVDGNDETTVAALKKNWPEIPVLRSQSNVGPGGGRNKLIRAAAYPLIASFDDDSYPIDSDYFARLSRLFEQYPQAGVIAAKIFHPGQPLVPATSPVWVVNFTGCGCAYRREVFCQTSGYVDLPVAYGMEEVDLALRLHALNWKILEASTLRVYHDTDLSHHENPAITAGTISNTILHAFLRYPVKYWGYGVLQCLNQVCWRLKNGRQRGVLQGIVNIPGLLWQHRKERQPVSPRHLRSYLRLREQKVPVFSEQTSDQIISAE